MPLRRVLDGLGGLSKRTLDVLNPFLANAHHTGLNPPVPTTKIRNTEPQTLVNEAADLTWEMTENPFGTNWDDLRLFDPAEPFRLRFPYRGRYRINLNLAFAQQNPEDPGYLMVNPFDLHYHGRATWTTPPTNPVEEDNYNDDFLSETNIKGTIQLGWVEGTAVATDQHNASLPAGYPHIHMPDGADTTIACNPVVVPYDAGMAFTPFPRPQMRLRIKYTTDDTGGGNIRGEVKVWGVGFVGNGQTEYQEIHSGEENIPISDHVNPDHPHFLTIPLDLDWTNAHGGMTNIFATFRREGTDGANDTHTGDLSIWGMWIEYEQAPAYNIETSFFSEVGWTVALTRYTYNTVTETYDLLERERHYFSSTVSSIMTFKDGDYLVIRVDKPGSQSLHYPRSIDEDGNPVEYELAIFDRTLSVEYLGPQVLLPGDTPV